MSMEMNMSGYKCTIRPAPSIPFIAVKISI